MSTGPVGEWTYAHRKGLRIGAVALFALIFVFWGHPTGSVVIVLVVVLLLVLGLIELIGRPPRNPGPQLRPRPDPGRVTRRRAIEAMVQLSVRCAYRPLDTERIPTMTTPAKVEVHEETQGI